MASDDTRRRILEAAERLFAARGFSATSLRAVTREADVNLAAVNYHFGSKDELISAVFARSLGPLNRERLTLLEAAVAGASGGRPSVEEVVATLIRPAVGRVGRRDGKPSILAGLLGHVHSENDEHVRALVFEQFAATKRRYCEVLSCLLPELSAAELESRFRFVIGAMASALLEYQRVATPVASSSDGEDIDTLVARLVSFVSGGLTAAPAGGVGKAAAALARKLVEVAS